MPETRIAQASATDLTNAAPNASVDSASLDQATNPNETTYQNSDWNEQLGYYKNTALLNALIDAKARWTVGKGSKSDEITTMLLDAIRGWGNDTFNTIIENMARVMEIGGDSYSEIIRDEDGELINLKPLNTGDMIVVADNKGLIKRYEKTIVGSDDKINFEPDEILHFSRNRIADEIHGNSMIPPVVDIILAIKEASEDMKTLMHRHVKPMRLWFVDTDDPAEISSFKSKVDNANNKTENMILPKGTVETEIVAVPTNATLSPLPWLDYNDQKLFQATGVPPIIIGGSKGFTEAAEKMLYLSFQQTTEESQLYIEEQILSQLNLVIELEFPASLENELLSDKSKDAQNGAAQQNETTAGSGQ